jgi:hypothetical protein
VLIELACCNEELFTLLFRDGLDRGDTTTNKEVGRATWMNSSTRGCDDNDPAFPSGLNECFAVIATQRTRSEFLIPLDTLTAIEQMSPSSRCRFEVPPGHLMIEGCKHRVLLHVAAPGLEGLMVIKVEHLQVPTDMTCHKSDTRLVGGEPLLNFPLGRMTLLILSPRIKGRALGSIGTNGKDADA